MVGAGIDCFDPTWAITGQECKMNTLNSKNITLNLRLLKFWLMVGLLSGSIVSSGHALAATVGIVITPSHADGIYLGFNEGRHAPPPRHEVIGIAPFHGAVWVPGQWVWRDRWVWYRGQWAHHRYSEQVYWTPGYPMYREDREYRQHHGHRHGDDYGRFYDDQRGHRR